MIERFPFGKAPFCLLAIAIASLLLRAVELRRAPSRPDLMFVTFSEEHLEAYKSVTPGFEARRGVAVQLQYAPWKALQSRLQNAMQAGTDVPDLVEVFEGSLGFFTRGPRQDVRLLDLTDRVHDARLEQRLVASRFSLWSEGGRIYALPHDVHPVMLAYRRDLVEALGIDVTKLDTWDAFVEAGRKVTRDLDGDGVVDRYMIDLPSSEQWGLESLILQRGGQLVDERGQVAFDSDVTVDVIRWYLHQIEGKDRIAYSAGWGQPLTKAMIDGLVLFYVCPDWRSGVFAHDAPSLAGKMALMPLPAWEKGGRRTTIWGGTGLVLSKQMKDPDLAWDLANALYFDVNALGEQFKKTNILPILEEAWTLPEVTAPNPYYSNQPLGRLYAELAPSTPPRYVSALTSVAQRKLVEAFSLSLEYFKEHGDDGLTHEIHAQLSAAAEYVRLRQERADALAAAE